MRKGFRLYVKVACSVCRGKVRGCPYCGIDGKHYIEASDKSVVEWLQGRSEEDKELFRKALEGS